jgi:hypothetical protein
MCSDSVKVVYFFWSSVLNMGTDVGKPFLISPDSWNSLSYYRWAGMHCRYSTLLKVNIPGREVPSDAVQRIGRILAPGKF